MVRSLGNYGTVLTKLQFSSQIMNEPKKLEAYATLAWKSLPGTHTLAYLAHS